MAKKKVAKPNVALLEYVERLRQYDHGFLSDTGAQELAAPFGCKARTWLHYADPENPKGLTLKNGAKSAVGIDAARLAEQICNHVGVDYPSMFGRGSQLRVCCDALENWINDKKD